MKYRIAMWATAGFLVAVGWAILAVIVDPIVITSNPAVWTIARLTCPLVFAGFYFHFGVGLYLVLLSNATVYALVGLTVEALRKQLKHAI